MATTGLRHGDQGNAVITGTDPFYNMVVNVNKWEMDWPNDYFASDIFGTTNKGHKFYRGMYTITGTIEGYCNGTGALTASFAPGAATSTLTLTERTGVTLSGEAHLNIRWTVDRQTNLNSYVATFRSDGDWTETIA